jgi:sulfate/thiosulfate transport system ATP-binding protein
LRIRTVDVAKEFGRTGALRGVTLTIEDGELIALLGPSGSGKTTLLRVIAGLEAPTAGRVFFGEEDATGVPVQKRRIGFVFQNYALFKTMSVADNVAYGLRVLPRAERPSRSETARRVRELLELVQLSGLERRFPRQLSGGQQQRVALARALAVDPRVLLLDEPFGALDAKVRKDLRRWLRELHEQTGHTTVFVTHDQEEALELADRVAILNAGKLEQVGTPDEVYDHPASAFVMSFVGDTSSIPVEVADGRLLYAGQPFRADVSGTCGGGGRLYVRPKDVVIGPPETGLLLGTVINAHRTAAGRRAQIALVGGSETTIIEAEVGLSQKLVAGERVGLRFIRGRAFPAEAGA